MTTMKLRTAFHLFLPLFPALASASDTPTAAPESSGVRMVVTPEGAFLRDASLPAPDAGTQAQTGGLIWTHTDGGLLWIGENVSIGNGGSEVFTEYALNNEADALLSSNDTNPPTPLWTSPALGAEDQHVASSDSGS